MQFKDRGVLIVGASGGLGGAIARAFAAEGARLALTGSRAGSTLPTISGAQTFQADITQAASVTALRDAVAAEFGRVDVLVNAAGYDVRKSLSAHTDAEIDRSLAVNLRGPMLLTRAFLPGMQAQGSGQIVHLGGFADGRLAFPYYSVDAATRAGLYTFIESVNRELRGTAVLLSYFSPSPADTEAERPFHALWQQLGQAVVPSEQVAHTLLDAVAERRRVAIMGGLVTRLFAALNSVAPGLADTLALRQYGEAIGRYLAAREAGR